MAIQVIQHPTQWNNEFEIRCENFEKGMSDLQNIVKLGDWRGCQCMRGRSMEYNEQRQHYGLYQMKNIQ
jgi:hypothetical protein